MNNSEFRPHPAEFNLGYQASRRKKEEKKERRWMLARKLKILLTSTLLIMPLTINIGLWDIHSFKFGPGTYECGTSLVHFDEDTGWFYNGSYFIPLTWNQTELTYQAAGAYPETSDATAHEMDCYYVKAGGDIEVRKDGIVLLDPFSQEKLFYTESKQEVNSSSVDSYNANGISLDGSWKGLITPGYSYPTAYPTDLTFQGTAAWLTATDTYGNGSQRYVLYYSIRDCVLSFSYPQPLTYSIVTPEKTINFEYNDILEGVLFFTQQGTYLHLNVFTSQVFEK